MKLLLVCDDTIIKYDGKFYFPSKERFDFYQRYLRVFDNLRLVGREESVSDLKGGFIPLDKEPRLDYIPLPGFHGPKEYITQYFETGRAMKKITQGCDAAVLRLPSTVAQRAYKYVKKAKLPYAVEVVFDSYDGFKSAKKIYLKVLYYTIYKQLLDTCYNADGVSCVTEHYLQQRYFSKKPNAFTSHYSSLALEKDFYTSARLYPAKKVFTIAHTAKQVMFNGRKGHNEILQALCILKKRDVQVNVIFIGPSYNNGCEKLTEYAKELGVANQVKFVGRVSREELSQHLDQSDLYVMPTKAEGLPRVIIEAMAKGMPCITTPVSGNPELINSHYLVDYDNVHLLADRIEELVSDRCKYETESARNFMNSQKYEASILEKRRDAFYTQLKKFVRK